MSNSCGQRVIATRKLFSTEDRMVSALVDPGEAAERSCSWWATWLVKRPISTNILLHRLTDSQLCFGIRGILFRTIGATQVHHVLLVACHQQKQHRTVFPIMSRIGRSHYHPMSFCSAQSVSPYYKAQYDTNSCNETRHEENKRERERETPRQSIEGTRIFASPQQTIQKLSSG